MDFSMIPFNQDALRRMAGDGIIRNACYNDDYVCRRVELQVDYPDGSKRFFVMTDNGRTIYRKEVIIREVYDKKSRNKEIRRLYHEEELTQMFLAKVFRLSQSRISGILNEDH